MHQRYINCCAVRSGSTGGPTSEQGRVPPQHNSNTGAAMHPLVRGCALAQLFAATVGPLVQPAVAIDGHAASRVLAGVHMGGDALQRGQKPLDSHGSVRNAATCTSPHADCRQIHSIAALKAPHCAAAVISKLEREAQPRAFPLRPDRVVIVSQQSARPAKSSGCSLGQELWKCTPVCVQAIPGTHQKAYFTPA